MSVVINTIVPVAAIVFLGYFLAGRRELHTATLADLSLLITAPALVFGTLANTTLAPERGLVLVAGVLWIVVFTGALAAIYVWRSRESVRGVIPAAVFWNAGNIGLPTARLAFGEEGLEVAVLMFVIVAILQFSIGIWIAKGEQGWKEALKLPLLYASGAGLIVSATGVELPAVILEPVTMLGSMAVPVMLLTLGVQLRRLEVTDVRHSMVAIAIRMGGGFAAAVAFVSLTSVAGVDRQVLLLAGVLPAAVVNVVIAQRYDSNPGLVASAIVLGTLTSLILISLLVYFIA